MSAPALAGLAGLAKWEAGGGQSIRTVTLITGDRVTVAMRGDVSTLMHIDRGPGRDRVSFSAHGNGDDHSGLRRGVTETA